MLVVEAKLVAKPVFAWRRGGRRQLKHQTRGRARLVARAAECAGSGGGSWSNTGGKTRFVPGSVAFVSMQIRPSAVSYTLLMMCPPPSRVR